MHTTHTAQNDKPTTAQLRYLKDLALARGESFATPTTKREASAEIQRLKRRKPTAAADARREIRDVQHDLATRRGDAASIRTDEITGHGSTATWKRDTTPTAPATRTTPTKPRPPPA